MVAGPCYCTHPTLDLVIRLLLPTLWRHRGPFLRARLPALPKEAVGRQAVEDEAERGEATVGTRWEEDQAEQETEKGGTRTRRRIEEG
jgi:hypothetical protein